LKFTFHKQQTRSVNSCYDNCYIAIASKFQKKNFKGFRVLASLLQRRRSPEANQTLHDVWSSPGLLHYIYSFGSSCPATKFCQVQYARYVQVLRSPILAALLHGTPAAGVSQTLRLGTRNRITEVLQTALPIFGWAAITLGIGPHSSFVTIVTIITTTTPGRGANYCYQRVYLSVYLSARIAQNTCPNFTKFSAPATCGRGSVLFLRHC